MESRRLFHYQLSSIMETMTSSVLREVCKLVDDDSAELRSELSRLLEDNSALAEKVNSLECELTLVRGDVPKLCTSRRSVGVQTVYDRDEEGSGPPTIEGIFGKEWCMNLWTGREPCSLEREDSPQSLEKLDVATQSDQKTVTEIKGEDCVEASVCQQQTLGKEEGEEGLAEEQLSVGDWPDGSSGRLSCDGEGQQDGSAAEEASVQLIPMEDTEAAFSTHIIPIEEDNDMDDDDDVQFVDEQEPAQCGPSADNSEDSTALEEDSHHDCNTPNVETTRDPNKDKLTCHICSRTFFHKGALTHHMKSHAPNFSYQHFPHRNKFNSHNSVVPPPSPDVTRSCPVCGKTFAHLSALRIHYLVHTGEKPHMCSYCGKGFTQKGNLKCHLRIHTGDRPFRCYKCGKTFIQKVNLNHHLTAHGNHDGVEKSEAETT